MTKAELEARVASLEAEVATLEKQLAEESEEKFRWNDALWEAIDLIDDGSVRMPRIQFEVDYPALSHWLKFQGLDSEEESWDGLERDESGKSQESDE
jgi:hypothetical protein